MTAAVSSTDHRMRRRDVRKFIGMPLALLGATVMLLTTGLMQASAGVQVPFRAAYSGTITFTSPATAMVNAAGVATYLGLTTVDGSLAAVPSASCDDGFSIEIHDTLAAANGDQVAIIVALEACPTAPGVVQASGSYVVTGGTGRFTGAGGGGDYTGVADFNTGRFSCTLTGTISHPIRH
jgi:hypothetical protein